MCLVKREWKKNFSFRFRLKWINFDFLMEKEINDDILKLLNVFYFLVWFRY